MPTRTARFLTSFSTFLVVLVCSISSLLTPSLVPVFAQDYDNSIELRDNETQTQPKERIVKVTATVNDSTPPSIPILISPPNDSHLSDNTPTFVWKGSYDEFGVSHYVLTLDGSVLFNNIPTSATDNSQYILTYDADTHYYSLTPKSAIGDGSHSWKITAVDIYNNTASSVTWTFTIDSQSPVFIVTEVDTLEQSISAQDVSTVPTTPIELINNEPILKGTGEANSQVEMFVKLPDGSVVSYTFTISGDGTWQVQLGTLPRDAVVYVTFRITDQVGHVSILENIPLILRTPTVTIPQIPFFPPTEEPIVIPLPPPAEVIPDIIDQLPLPPAITKFIATFPILTASPRPVGYFTISSILVLLLIAALPLLKTLILLGQFGTSFSLANLWEIWRVIGLIPGSRPQGIVVYQDSQAPVAFAKVIISGKLNDYHHATHTRLTNKEGIYAPSNLENGSYQANVLHYTSLFPTLVKKKGYLFWSHYYQGQEFTVDTEHHEPHFVIPVDQRKSETSLWQRFSWWLLHRQMTTTWMLAACILITTFAASYINILATLFYSICLLLIHGRFWQKKVVGLAVTSEKVPLIQVIVMVFNYEAKKLLAIKQTDQKGQFQTTMHKDKIRLWAIAFSFKLINSATVNDVATNTVVVENSVQRTLHTALILKEPAAEQTK